MGAAHSAIVQRMVEKVRGVRKSHRKEAPFELGLKRTGRQGWACRSECDHSGGRQGQ